MALSRNQAFVRSRCAEEGVTMSRSESTSFQVHPNDEQKQIKLMEAFHWSLLNSQEVKTVDSHLERRGDNIYSVTNSEHYVKLTFSRELDLPNLDKIKQLEHQFFSLPVPDFPKLFPGTVLLYLVLTLFYGAGIAIWLAYFFLYYSPKKEEAVRVAQSNAEERGQIMNQLEALN
jgi:hypothetical protein